MIKERIWGKICLQYRPKNRGTELYIDLVFTSSYTTQTNSVLHPLWLANSDVHGKPVLEKAQRAGVAHLYVIVGKIVNAGPAG